MSTESERHFYLYAKGHYPKSGGIIMDLKVVLANYTGSAVEHLQLNHVVSKLIEITFPDDKVCRQVSKLLYKIYDDGLLTDRTRNEIEDYNYSVSYGAIIYCLGALATTRVDEIPYTLGDIDSKIYRDLNFLKKKAEEVEKNGLG